MEKAKEDMEEGLNTKYVQFFHKVKKASADFRAYHMLKIREAGDSGTWQASAWLLERCYPEEFGRSINVFNLPPSIVCGLRAHLAICIESPNGVSHATPLYCASGKQPL